MVFKKASKEDIEELVFMREAFLLEEHNDINEQKMETIKKGSYKYLDEHLNDDCFVFVGIEDERIVSTVFLIIFEKPAGPSFLTGKIGNIINVYTLPEYRKKGIASELVQMALREAKMHNVSYVELKASKMGESVYQKIGFQEETMKYKMMKYDF